MSKSGSKALSRSVDSVVKSVESVVKSFIPKEMNMKHVLLAVLVGLLLCMMMSQNVEGFTKLVDPVNNTPYFCPAGGAVANLETGDNDGDGAITAAQVGQLGCLTAGGDRTVSGSWNDAPIIRSTAAGTGCNEQANAGPYKIFPASGEDIYCGRYCNDLSASPAGNYDVLSQPTEGEPLSMMNGGSCTSTVGGTIAKNVCSKKAEATCLGDCTWKPLIDSVKEEYDPHLRNLYDNIISDASLIRQGCPSGSSTTAGGIGTSYLPTGGVIDNIVKSQVTSPLKLRLTTDIASDDVVATDSTIGWGGLKVAGGGNTTYHDFFYLLLGDVVDDNSPNKKPVSKQISESANIPEELKLKLNSIVTPVEEKWNALDPEKVLINLNGGRIIAGYNSNDGLVIRNIPTQPIILTGSRASFHRGAGCPTTWDDDAKEFTGADITCPLNTPCDVILTHRDAIRKKLSVWPEYFPPLATNKDVRNYCSLDSCASSDVLPECVLNRQLLRAENNISALASKVSGYII